MSLFTTFLRHELRLQARSMRFRALATCYLLCSCFSPLLMVFTWRSDYGLLLPETVAGNMHLLQPLLVTALSALLAVDGLTRERDEGSITVLGVAGLSDSAYVLLRWVSIEVIVLLLTLGVQLAGYGLAWGVTGTAAVQPFFGPWALHLLPLSLGVSALFLAAGGLTGSLVSASVGIIGLIGLALSLGNDLLAWTGRHLSGPWDWVFGRGLAGALARTDVADRGGVLGGLLGRLAEQVVVRHSASGGVPDWRAALDAAWAQAILPAGLCMAGLALSVRYLRRSRPDVRPWNIPATHPLRTYLKQINALRVALHPGPQPDLADRAFVALGLLILVLAGSAWWARDAGYRTLGAERFAAEAGAGYEPTPDALRPGTWHIEADLSESGFLRSTSSLELLNTGEEPIGHAAFELHPSLELLAVASEGASVSSSREWDRLELRWSPPLAPGELRRFQVEIEGRPVEVTFNVRQPSSFHGSWRRAEANRLSSELADLTLSRSVRLASARSVVLRAATLAPVPRYTPWVMERQERRVLPDATSVSASFELDLSGPDDWLLSSSCGGVAPVEKGRRLVSARCRLTFDDFLVAGGRLVEATDGRSAITFITLPSHAESVELHRAVYESAATIAEGIWPEFGRGGSLVVVELPAPWSPSPFQGMQANQWELRDPPDFAGRLLLQPERLFAAMGRSDPKVVARGLLRAELRDLRESAPGHEIFWRGLIDFMVLSERGDAGSARVMSSPAGRERISRPVAGPDQPADDSAWWMYEGWYVQNRLRPRLVDVRGRVGPAAFRGAVTAFFLGRQDRPATAEEFFERLARSSGLDLGGFRDDYILGAALPRLTLDQVAFEQDEHGWTCRGFVRNDADGRALVDLLLRTEGAPIEQTLTVGPGETVPFRFESVAIPRRVELDPAGSCFRWVPPRGIGVTEVVHFEGDS